MKQFLKFTLATIVGFLVVNVIGFFLLFGVVVTIASFAEEKPTILTQNSVYQLDLDGALIDRSTEADPFSGLLEEKMYGFSVNTIGLDDILANIKKAKENDNILGIYLKSGSFSGGYASVKEIRDALLDFKTSGKFIVAYADTYTQKAYYLCSVADKVLANPIGMLEWQGISAQTTFYKNVLDKLGVEMQIVRVGTFKSAVEPYIATQMSDANREQVSVYINSIWKEVKNAVSISRGISPEKLNEYADEMLTFRSVTKAVEYSLIDSLVYADEVKNVLKFYTDSVSEIHFVKHTAMNRLPVYEAYDENTIALIYALGAIDYPGEEGINSEKLTETINNVAKDESVKAVVFRVSSPGGSAYGSEQIWHALDKLKEKKTLIVSMGDYAASGGYYISCLADSIFAQPNTITGSIGIFGQIPNFKGLMDKIGIRFDNVNTNKLSSGISINRAFTPEERNIMQTYVNEGYELFVKRCAEGRRTTSDEIKKIAEGRVWTGSDAVPIGLVDRLGGINDAIAAAAAKAELETYQIVEFPRKETFSEKLFKSLSGDVRAKIAKTILGEEYVILREMKNVEKQGFIQAKLPYEIIIN